MTAHLVKLKSLLQTYTVLDAQEVNLYEIEHIKDAVEEITQLFKWDLEEKQNESADILIPNLQNHLTYLADGATAFDRANPLAAEINDFVKFLVLKIYDLIYHLLTYYPHYFDFDADIPAHYQDYQELSYASYSYHAKQLLIERNLDEDLILLLTDFFCAARSGQRFQIHTWRQWQYREKLFDLLYKTLKLPHIEDATLETLKVLLSFELNSIQVYSYFIKYIEKISLSTSPAQEQEQELLYLIKLFRQVRVEVKMRFDPDSPSLKESVLESLEAELAYVKQKDEVIISRFKAAHPDGQNRFYFKVAVTLPELMFFFRILLEIGMMVTRFNSYLYEFISKHIKTERADNISKKSMRNHFSNKPFPDRIVNSVRSWFEKAIQHIDQHYK